ncbi:MULTISPECIES: NUDIX hydrolase [Tsukamurella]|uniref:NUDIX domain-containing protein n=2 Tax=Tsukamurella TaxID=2060 RepID=A0A5C5S8I6_9ACTN|nr:MULTISPECIES: NUDIX domain-containing protein [Tsukamurella]NMD57803.1 NUDIX domain-containing protein [Tsukamurella columbiensis]TWS30843.1 NUDIX domain-containing protein [Tsukamurella conjunctivitidis]
MTLEEIVALYDDAGRPSGSAPRSRVRAENLRHGTTGILVFDSDGRIYVHRRTPIKDVYPGLRDFCAGGVLLAGESPDDGAAREAFEELGVHGVELRPVGVRAYADARTRFLCFQYVCTYDGAVVHQPEEVESGGWMAPADLLADVAADPGDFVPDSVELALHLVSGGGGSGQDSSVES